MIFMNISSVDDCRQLHGLFMYWCKSESVAKVVQPQHRLIPALVVLWALVVLEMAHQGTWLKLTGVPWMALVALQWWQAHTKYRHFQPIWTQSQHWTPSCTLIRLLKYLLTINGKLLAPPGICQLCLFQYNRYFKQTGSRQSFTEYPDLKFMFTWLHSSSV